MSDARRLGPYAILEPLGQGGMGAVFKARDDRTGAVVALKVVKFVQDPEFLVRFEREARTARSIAHPHITAVVDSGVESGIPYIAFELVPGGTLKARLKKEGKLPWTEAVRIAREMATALGAIHGVGLVHRDLKPENVLFTLRGAETGDWGNSKVSDFGLARQVGTRSELTRTGEVVGTAAYMAPEQAKGLKEIDARTDLYSLGVVLFEMLTGEAPFKGEGMTLLVAHISDPPPAPSSIAPEIPHELEDLVLSLLAKAPEARPQTADDVVQALDAVAAPRGLGRSVFLLLGVAAASIVLLLGAVAVRPGRAASEDPSVAPVVSRAPSPRATPRPRPSPSPSPSPTPTPTPTPSPVMIPRSEVPLRDLEYPDTAAGCLKLAEEKSETDRGAALLFAQRATQLEPLNVRARRALHDMRITLHVDDEPAPAEKAEVERMRGGVESLVGKQLGTRFSDRSWTEANDAIKNAIQIDWTSGWAWCSLGIILEETGDFEGAEQAQGWAIALDKTLLPARERHVHLLLKLYQADSKEAHLPDALQELKDLLDAVGDKPAARGNALRVRAEVRQQIRMAARIKHDAATLATQTRLAIADLREAATLLPVSAEELNAYAAAMEQDK